MSEEGLDNLFKKNLLGRNVKFNMNSWHKMEQMLPPETKGGYFSTGTTVAIMWALFAISAFVFVWSYESDGETLLTQNFVNHKETQSIINNATVPSNIPRKQNEIGSNGFGNKSIIQNDITSNRNRIANIESVVPQNKNTQTVNTNNENPSVLSSKMEKSHSIEKLINNSASKTSFDLNKQKRNPEKKVLFSNAFTKISGIDELATMSLVQEEEEQTLFINVDNRKLPNADKNVVGFIGGVSINESLTGISKGLSGSEFFGVNYQRYLNGGFSLKSNLLYVSRNQINTLKILNKKSYDFGSKIEQTAITSQRLMYLELPIMVNYGFKNHNVMIGGSFSYLMGSLNKQHTTHTSLTEETRHEYSKKWGYAQGFKPYDIALVAGYEYNFNSKLNLGLRLNYGLLDVTDNKYFGTTSFDNNIQFRVYLTYSPFQF